MVFFYFEKFLNNVYRNNVKELDYGKLVVVKFDEILFYVFFCFDFE